VFIKPFTERSNSTFVCIGRWVGPVKDPDFAKQDDRNSAARPLTDIPTKLLQQGFDVPSRQAAAYGTGEDQLKGALVLPLHSSMVLPHGTMCGFRLAAHWIRITLPLSGRQDACGGEAEIHWWPVHSRGLLD
jgi:hypothetical protein